MTRIEQKQQHPVEVTRRQQAISYPGLQLDFYLASTEVDDFDFVEEERT